MILSGQQKGTGGGKRNNTGANRAAAEMLDKELRTRGFCCAVETKYKMEADGWPNHTAMKVPHAVQTLLYYSNIYDLEEFYYRPPELEKDYRPSNRIAQMWRGYKALRWRAWSKKSDLKTQWTCQKKGGPIRNDDGSIRDEVLKELKRLENDWGA